MLQPHDARQMGPPGMQAIGHEQANDGRCDGTDQHGAIVPQHKRKAHHDKKLNEARDDLQPELDTEIDRAAVLHHADVFEPGQRRRAGQDVQDGRQPRLVKPCPCCLGTQRDDQARQNSPQGLEPKRGVEPLLTRIRPADQRIKQADGRQVLNGAGKRDRHGHDTEISRQKQAGEHKGADKAQPTGGHAPGDQPSSTDRGPPCDVSYHGALLTEACYEVMNRRQRAAGRPPNPRPPQHPVGRHRDRRSRG